MEEKPAEKDNNNGEVKKEEAQQIQPLKITIIFDPYTGNVNVEFPRDSKIACLGMLEMANHLIVLQQKPEDKIITPQKHGILNFARNRFK